MSVFQTVYDAHLTIAGHQITWREIIGNAFGFASAIGGLRRRVWAWPVGIVGNVLLFTVFIGTAVNGQAVPLLGQAGRQIFFIAVSIYGWQRWQQAKREHAGPQDAAVSPRWATGRERAAYLLAAVIGVVALFFVFREIGTLFPVPTWYFLADSWIFVGSILATYAMARGWVDFWLCWIAVDLVGVPELIYFKLYPSATLYGVYGVLVIYGFFAWRRIAREEPLADPQTEMVGA
ncbi:MAG: nicotinamide mononucleotide transporter [Nocardioidaceae bacterium]|nr:nicotinamide mononucleotide transporter [Nocardioidaceae bacterium]